MTIYFFTISLLFTFSLLETYKSISLRARSWMFFIAYLVLVVQTGLRWETGTDWNTYFNHFELITDFSSTSPLKNGVEYGYNILMWVMKLIFPNYSFFLIINALIFYFLIFKSFQRYSSNLFLTLMLFYTLSMGILGSNRQLIALAICIYAIRYAIEKKPIIFFLLIALAISFHTTAFLFIIYYFLNREIKPLALFLILGCSFIIGKTQLPLLVFSNIGDLTGGSAATKVYFYLEGAKSVLAEYQLSIIGLIKRIVFLSVFYYNRKKLSEMLLYYNLMLNGYIIGLAFYFLFANSLLIIVSRGSLYFNMMEPILVASQICLFRKRENKVVIVVIFLIFSIFFLYQSISAYSDLFIPYKGIFINSEFHRNIH